MVAPLGQSFPSDTNTELGGDGVREGDIRRVKLAVGQHPRGKIGRGARAAESESRQVAVHLLRDREPSIRRDMRIFEDDV